MSTSKKIHFIVNPAANRGRSGGVLPKLKEILDSRPLDYSVYITASRGHAIAIASSIPDGSTVVAVGGDGTINEVANGIYGRSCTLAIIPIGSGNDFAKMFQLPKMLVRLVELIAGGKPRSIDSGRLIAMKKDGTAIDRIFMNAVGIGLDAMVNYENAQLKLLRGFPAYVYAALKVISTYHPEESNIRFGNFNSTANHLLVAIGNGTTVGGGFKLTPNAVMDDRLLDLCWAGDLKIGRILRVLPTVLSGNHLQFADVYADKSESITVTSDHGMPVHMDGEMIGLDVTSVHASIAEKKIQFLG